MNAEQKISDLIVSACPISMLGLIWHQVEPILQRVVDRVPDDLTMFAIQKRLMSGQQMMVTVSRGADIIAVNIIEVKVLDSGKRTLYLPIIGGDEFDAWSDQVMDVAKAIAKDYNCTELRGMSVRKGWMHKLKKYGWEESFTTLKLELGE